MVKHFLKGTDKEVKIGDKIHIKVPMKTPYGEGSCEVDTVITQASLEQLCKNGIVEKKEFLESGFHNPSMEFSLYKPYIKRLARRLTAGFEDAVGFLDILKETSPYAHNCLLLDLMASVMNGGKKFGKYAFVVNLEGDTPITKVLAQSTNLPKFANLEDARNAARLIMPFVMEARHGE